MQKVSYQRRWVHSAGARLYAGGERFPVENFVEQIKQLVLSLAISTLFIISYL